MRPTIGLKTAETRKPNENAPGGEASIPAELIDQWRHQ